MRSLPVGVLRGVAGIALALLAGCASAPQPVIRGTVGVPLPRAAAAHSARSAAEAVVYLEALPASVSPAGKKAPHRVAPLVPPHHARSTLVFQPQGLGPRVVPVTRGDSVAFVNRDQRFHSAFSVSAAKKFDLGSLRPGAARLAAFDRQGVVRVFCKLHSDSSAFVFVAPNAVWVRPDANGAFALPPLPAGTYDVRVWHPVYGERRRKVTLPAAGASVAFDY
jgi:plastocyanin